MQNSIVKNEWIREQEYLEKPLYPTVDENIEYIKKIMGNSFDLVTRTITLENDFQSLKIGIVLMDGLADLLFTNQVILKTITDQFSKLKEKIKSKDLISYFHDQLLTLSNVNLKDKYGDLINFLLNGDTIIILDGEVKFFTMCSKGFNERAIEAPTNDISVKGSKESFTENLATNLSMIRRRMKNPNLWVKRLVIGKKTNCNVAIVYINGVTDEKLVKMVEERLNRQEIESIVDSSYLKHYLREPKHSVFPLIYDTERPDTVIGNLNEGRLAIIVDGSPFVLIAPCTFFHFISSVEDYYNKSFVGSSFRIMRLIALFLALFLPGFYMCIVKFNSDLLPINLMYSITGQRENVPLPSELEIFLTLFAFDLLTEAGTRMPIAVGSALSFVGAIVIGQSAVEANLISSMMLIVVAINGIGTLTISDYDMCLTIKSLKYLVVLFSLAFGLFGFTISVLLLLVHLISLRSFGEPYLYPIAPLTGVGLLDSIIVAPLSKLLKRKGKEKQNEKN